MEQTVEQLQAENAELRKRLAAALETLHAIEEWLPEKAAFRESQTCECLMGDLRKLVNDITVATAERWFHRIRRDAKREALEEMKRWALGGILRDKDADSPVENERVSFIKWADDNLAALDAEAPRANADRKAT